MTSTSALSGLGSSADTAASKPRGQLDQDAFLQLMVAQFKNQDPTKPKDPSEFLGQLAQFSTVSGIQSMQASIVGLSESLRSQNVLGGAVLVGREIMAPMSGIEIAAGEVVTGAVDIPEGVSTVDVSIKDSAGQLVRRITVPAHSGLNEFAWDGITDRGTQAGAGHYEFEITAKFGSSTESLPVLLNTTVNSVTIDPTTQGLTLNTRGLGAVSLSDVRRVI
jgi:flagellar basal-body rod modification protein FlgD